MTERIMKITTFLKELHALEKASGKPILMKAMNLNWNLLDLKLKLPNIHFIYIKRDILYNAQSLLNARNKFFGNTENSFFESTAISSRNEILRNMFSFPGKSLKKNHWKKIRAKATTTKWNEIKTSSVCTSLSSLPGSR